MNKKIQLTLDDVTQSDRIVIPIPTIVFNRQFKLNWNTPEKFLYKAKNQWKHDFYDYVYQLDNSTERNQLESKYFNVPSAEKRKFIKGMSPEENHHRKRCPGEIILPEQWEYHVNENSTGIPQDIYIQNAQEREVQGMISQSETITHPYSKESMAPEKLLLLANQDPVRGLPESHVVLPIFKEHPEYKFKDRGVARLLETITLGYVNAILQQMQE
ncbi:hypothetical protein K9M74_03085 [Candidatus Woesearchaeota archaeon]|nr:hypothetical protein [Candidatus Woesearchaeota archaeon]